MVMGIQVQDVLGELGRDDERGFHVQELLSIGVEFGFAFVPFEFEPEVERAPCTAGKWVDGECVNEVQVDVFGSSDYVPCASCNGTGLLPKAPLVVLSIDGLMRVHNGVLFGKRKDASHLHAVAWCRETQLVLDPEQGIYNLDGFEPETFWASFRIQ